MGTYLTGTFNVIHNTGATDFNNFVYSAVYFNSGGTYDINNTSVIGVGGETLEIIVDGNTTTLNSGFLLLGNPIAPQTKIKTGLISTTGGTEHYQFVNIKTGLPTNG
tara:strand:- start:1740 stop:2060 length:321 start_codon:yes stop_codon:yes gene_type:complete